MDTLEARIARLEAESQIRQLIARYSFDIDDRQIARLPALFCRNAVLRSRDGVMHAVGPEAILAQYHQRFAALGPGQHVMHDVLIEFESAVAARGRVAGHAELVRNGAMMVAALRYDDRYALEDGAWRFAERVISFLYYVPVGQWPGILLQPDRNRAYAAPRPADYPEPLDSWRAYAAGAGTPS